MSRTFTTRQAARKLGIDAATLSRYVSSGKVPPPQIVKIGNFSVHSWTEEDVERTRKLLPKIANGRKTWRQKRKLEKQEIEVRSQKSGKRSNQQSVKPKSKKSKP